MSLGSSKSVTIPHGSSGVVPSSWLNSSSWGYGCAFEVTNPLAPPGSTATFTVTNLSNQDITIDQVTISAPIFTSTAPAVPFVIPVGGSIEATIITDAYEFPTFAGLTLGVRDSASCTVYIRFPS